MDKVLDSIVRGFGAVYKRRTHKKSRKTDFPPPCPCEQT